MRKETLGNLLSKYDNDMMLKIPVFDKWPRVYFLLHNVSSSKILELEKRLLVCYMFLRILFTSHWCKGESSKEELERLSKHLNPLSSAKSPGKNPQRRRSEDSCRENGNCVAAEIFHVREIKGEARNIILLSLPFHIKFKMPTKIKIVTDWDNYCVT